MNVKIGRSATLILGLVSMVAACASGDDDTHGGEGSATASAEGSTSAATTSSATSTSGGTTTSEATSPAETSDEAESSLGSDAATSMDSSGGSMGDATEVSGADETASEMPEIRLHLASEDDPRAPTTVGIVSWSPTGGMPSAATIQFGPTTDYGIRAPMDLTAASPRGVLLGMKPNQTYHVRIVATIDGEEYVSDDHTITTGAPPEPDRLSPVTFDILSDEAREPGFVIGSYWNGPNVGMVFILDQDGEFVWWYDPQLEDGVGKAALSADGRDLWMIDGGLRGEPLVRVGMDGLDPQTYPGTRGSHDIIPVEGDRMAFINYGTPLAAEIDRSGQLRPLLEMNDLPLLMTPHPNALAYDDGADRYLMSDLMSDVYFFPSTGASPDNLVLLTSLVGPNTVWGEHMHRAWPLPDDHLLLFANRGGEANQASRVIEYDLNTGEEVWSYESGAFTANYGDVQRLPGGNTLVTFSNAGVIHEVTPEGELVLEIITEENLGYVTWVPSLYGTSDPARDRGR